MWPGRKTLLAIKGVALDFNGLTKLLEVLGREFVLASGNPGYPDVRNGVLTDIMASDLEGQGTGPTEIVHDEGMPEDAPLLVSAGKLGLRRYSVDELLHNLLGQETVLAVSPPYALWQGRPLLWQLLESGGYEPSLVWQQEDGTWIGHKGRGMHWVVPEPWLIGLAKKVPGRMVAYSSGIAWKLEGDTVAFYYREGESLGRFVGSMPRWTEAGMENKAYHEIACALGLGVSWFDIKRALEITGGKEHSWLRWVTDDFRWDARPCGEGISSS